MTLLTGVTKKDRVDIEELLMHFADYDLDFCGENGPEYLWDEAADMGFQTNAAYAWALVKTEKSPDAIIKKFVDLWMSNDAHYTDYWVDIVENNYDSNILFVALSYCSK